MKPRFILLALLVSILSSAQDALSRRWSGGLLYGVGNEFPQKDYTYTNRYFQAQVYYSFNPGARWEYQVALQPEYNRATHQLLNMYFVTPDDPNYEEKREEYTKLKDINEYILNCSFFVRRNFSKRLNVYFMANVGPMITDTETERLSKGFAFCDVFALGMAYRMGDVTLDLRPNYRHTSNAGLQSSNAGFNTYNIAFGVTVPL